MAKECRHEKLIRPRFSSSSMVVRRIRQQRLLNTSQIGTGELLDLISLHEWTLIAL